MALTAKTTVCCWACMLSEHFERWHGYKLRLNRWIAWDMKHTRLLSSYAHVFLLAVALAWESSTSTWREHAYNWAWLYYYEKDWMEEKWAWAWPCGILSEAREAAQLNLCIMVLALGGLLHYDWLN
jgi:hypothetical protein